MRIAPAVVGIIAADLSKSLTFYRDLGLPIPEGVDDAPHLHVEVSDSLHLAWDTRDTVRSFDASWTPSSGGHAIALCFECSSPDEVDQVYAAMTAKGHTGHLAPWDAVWQQRYAVLHDPDGNAVELFSPLPH